MAVKQLRDESSEAGFPEHDDNAAQGAGAVSGTTDKAKPLHEERLGRVKAVVWANQTANGVRYNVQFKRIFKREGSSSWEQSDSFGRDDLPLVMEVARRA